MISELLKKEREGINHFFDHFDELQMQSIVEMIFANSGILFFTGIGKSGLIAKKIAQTMTSTGTKALYLSPLDALHGDIGIASSQDIFFLLSKSGESDELLNLLPIIRAKQAKSIAVVSNLESRLAKAVDFKIYLPCKEELCPFDMAPTISTTIQMIFGDTLAIALMKKRNFSKDQFVENHPAGRIGKRMSLKVKHLMLQGASLPLCEKNDRLSDILVELSNKKTGCILVLGEGNSLEGIFTDGDLRRSLQHFGSDILDKKMDELMTKTPKWVAAETLAVDAVKIMENDQKKAITVLPVLEGGQKLVGLISLHDILQSGI
ncbi:MAG TPA: KpsF/GutQ family sugar-phosphate isomerase [Parachlamydiaceae bacterium]|nr:KpsF/GutQ family sugar-phosphate isomerase [Parachlamydiaceae bacterium]